MPRNGKITRLPRHVREQVNLELDDNLNANEILAWLNELPETKAVLLKHFGGAPVSKRDEGGYPRAGHTQSNQVKVRFGGILGHEKAPFRKESGNRPAS